MKNLNKLVAPLYSNTSIKGQKCFNKDDIKLVQEIKREISRLTDLKLPLDTDYLIIEYDGSNLGWGAILLAKPNKYSRKEEEQICRYASEKYKEKGNISSIDAELLAVKYALHNFILFIINKPEITIRTDCESVVKFHKTYTEKRSGTRRWLNFYDSIIGNGYKVKFEPTKGSDNKLAYYLSRTANTIFDPDDTAIS